MWIAKRREERRLPATPLEPVFVVHDDFTLRWAHVVPTVQSGLMRSTAYGGAPLTGVLRSQPEDFRVIEQLGYDADEEGEHVLLRLRKRGITTGKAVDILANFAGVPAKVVGFAGMKDRHAVAEQSVSVQLAGRAEPNWDALNRDDLQVLAHARHRRKLKRGALDGNAFIIILRDVQGDRDAADLVLQQMQNRGVPNYFGAQRFGRHGDNVEQARAMFAGRRVRRQQRSILLSAARSHIFNAILDVRVRDQSWNQAIDGELYSLAGSRSWFGPEPGSDALRRRVAEGDIHPSGALWGDGPSPAGGASARLENAIADDHAELAAGLADARMTQDRRALRLLPQKLTWTWLDEHKLELRFGLPAGCYATSVIRECAAV